MVRYTFEVVAEVGKGNHIHSEIEVDLLAKDVEDIISFIKENYKDLDFRKFQSQHPELDERIESAALAELPHMLDRWFYSEDDMTGYWWSLPDELKELAEVELGHPLGDPDKKYEEPTEEELEFEEWVKEHGDELMAAAEADYQERMANHVPLFPKEGDIEPETSNESKSVEINGSQVVNSELESQDRI